MDNGFISAAEVTAKGRRDVDLPTGGKIRIQRVGPGELAEILGHLPDVSALAVEPGRSAEALGRPESKAVLKAISGVILAGVIVPKLYDDPLAGPTPRDFPLEDQLLIFNQVLELSGFTKAAGGKVLPLSKTAG